ncbi:MAG: cupin [Cyanobacteria bacterium SZAS LIN-3]|nr:cupin [Cyanobacteria bacterium SZAS LIN-3]
MKNPTRPKSSSISELTSQALYFEYTKAADPIGSGSISQVPYAEFPASLHQGGSTALIPLDVSEALGCEGPATSPALCANFAHILPGEQLTTSLNATSILIYVMRGSGCTEFGDLVIPWQTGDFIVLPTGSPARHMADTDSAFYLVHDEPLLRYLGAEAKTPRFKPTLYTAESSRAKLQEVERDGEAVNRSRISVLLANKEMDQTLTVTHTLWAMLGVLPEGTVQLPHRHQSVALDLILDCEPGCYSLVGPKLDAGGAIIDPVRVDWQPYSAFITPPGHWHAHHNESGKKAHLIPMQDAGLHTYLRSLDIRFVLPGKS